MKSKQILIIAVLLAASWSAASCSGEEKDIGDAVAEGVAATQTMAAWEAELESARQTEEASAVEAAAPEPIVHTTVPGEPSEASNTYVTDFNSIDFAEEGFTYGDQFLINRYERPFTVEMGEYRGYLDIILANLKANPPWIYVDVYFADSLPEAAMAKYGIEFDVDEDGRGDFLLQAGLPAPGEWTAGDVAVYEDQDEDVGGSIPHIPDPEQAEGNGFEALLVMSGAGGDPDLAWVRRNPDDPTSLQFAIKVDLLGSQGFLWSVWADEGLMNPGLQEYNDVYTFEDAGSPYPEHQFYPIQAISLVDSTCISWYAYEPIGDEIGLCQVYYEQGPEQGWKLCYDLRDSVICFDECMKSCPPSLPAGWSCRRCNLPSAE